MNNPFLVRFKVKMFLIHERNMSVGGSQNFAYNWPLIIVKLYYKGRQKEIEKFWKERANNV